MFKLGWIHCILMTHFFVLKILLGQEYLKGRALPSSPEAEGLAHFIKFALFFVLHQQSGHLSDIQIRSSPRFLAFWFLK